MTPSDTRLLRIVAIGIILLVMACIVPPPLILLFYLLIGWIAYLSRVLPAATVNWAGVGSALLSLVGVLLLGQMIGGWLWREMGPMGSQPSRRWKRRWTAAGTAIVVLMFTSGIAAIGVTHQSVWLAKSDRPMFAYQGREIANRVRCAANMKAIGNAIQLYADAHGGRLPDSIEELAASGDLSAYSFVCPASSADVAPAKDGPEAVRQLRSDEGHNSYVYHGRGLTMPLPRGRILLCEPLLDHDNAGMNVLFGDMRIGWLSPAEASGALRGIDD